MHFTANQKKAILFIAVIFLFTVIFHWVDKVLHPVGTYDFTVFEEKFYSRLDSIQLVLKEDSLQLSQGAQLAGGLPEIKRNLQAPSSGVAVANSAEVLAPGQVININTATISELILLPRIGPKTAAKIVEYRNLNGKFAAKKDITNISGIGPKTYKQLKDLITVE